MSLNLKTLPVCIFQLWTLPLNESWFCSTRNDKILIKIWTVNIKHFTNILNYVIAKGMSNNTAMWGVVWFSQFWINYWHGWFCYICRVVRRIVIIHFFCKLTLCLYVFSVFYIYPFAVDIKFLLLSTGGYLHLLSQLGINMPSSCLSGIYDTTGVHQQYAQTLDALVACKCCNL